MKNRIFEIVFEKYLHLFSKLIPHRMYYRIVMGFRSVNRKITKTSLTNDENSGYTIYKQLISILNLKEGNRLLDYGCGVGGVGIHFARYLNPENYLGVDISGAAIKNANKNFPGYNFQRIRNNKDLKEFGIFDFVIAQSVFTHNPPHLLSEFLSTIKLNINKDSKVYVTFSVGNSDYNLRNVDFIYQNSTIEKSAQKNGFKCSIVDNWEHPSQEFRTDAEYVDCLYLFQLTS